MAMGDFWAILGSIILPFDSNECEDLLCQSFFCPQTSFYEENCFLFCPKTKSSRDHKECLIIYSKKRVQQSIFGDIIHRFAVV